MLTSISFELTIGFKYQQKDHCFISTEDSKSGCNQNRHWKENEQLKCYWFILLYREVFENIQKQDSSESNKKRDKNGIYKLMSTFICSRDATQCRTHIQKIKLGHQTDATLRRMETLFYKNRKIFNTEQHREKQILNHLFKIKYLYQQKRDNKRIQRVEKIEQKMNELKQKIIQMRKEQVSCLNQRCLVQKNSNLKNQQDQMDQQTAKIDRKQKKGSRWKSEQIIIHLLFCLLYRSEIKSGNFRSTQIFKRAQVFMDQKKTSSQIRSRHKRIFRQWKQVDQFDDTNSDHFVKVMNSFRRVYFQQRLLGLQHIKKLISQHLNSIRKNNNSSKIQQFQEKLAKFEWGEQEYQRAQLVSLEQSQSELRQSYQSFEINHNSIDRNLGIDQEIDFISVQIPIQEEKSFFF